jgi:hypothetical protein
VLLEKLARKEERRLQWLGEQRRLAERADGLGLSNSGAGAAASGQCDAAAAQAGTAPPRRRSEESGIAKQECGTKAARPQRIKEVNATAGATPKNRNSMAGARPRDHAAAVLPTEDRESAANGLVSDYGSSDTTAAVCSRCFLCNQSGAVCAYVNAH